MCPNASASNAKIKARSLVAFPASLSVSFQVSFLVSLGLNVPLFMNFLVLRTQHAA